VTTPVRGAVDRHAGGADHTARTPPSGLIDSQASSRPVEAAKAHQEEDMLKSPIGRCRFARLRAPPLDFFCVDEQVEHGGLVASARWWRSCGLYLRHQQLPRRRRLGLCERVSIGGLQSGADHCSLYIDPNLLSRVLMRLNDPVRYRQARIYDVVQDVPS
jgi:hypothetical protein